MAERYTVDITSLTHEGHGVAKVDGYTIFIPGALIGEQVICEIARKEKNYGFANLINVITPSKYRVIPPCPIFGMCGGCEIMHLEYSKQLDFKKQMIESTFTRIGHLDLKVDEVIGMENPYYYRNKVQIPFGIRHQKAICGYYQRKSHDIIPLESCHVQTDEMSEIIIAIKDMLNEFRVTCYDETRHTGCLRHVMLRRNQKNQIMVVLITYEDKMKGIGEIIHRLTMRFPSIVTMIQNMNHKTTNVILGNQSRVLYGDGILVDQIGNISYRISHYSFYQVNSIQTKVLYDCVVKYLNPNSNDVILDGYCGVGTISLYLAKHVKRVIGIEIVPEAIQDAIENATLNHIDNAQFVVGKVEEVIKEMLEKESISALVLDPPRKGLDPAVINAILSTNIPKIVYVSCDVATLARDLALFAPNYTIEKVTAIDMFPHTCDVETVVTLNQREENTIL
ncbi:MAG: 23S rRNA (uracil(1939)-C(5))-methyltransferase RlmD [Bacilli bacterium]|nr:23S rRNA (uracil(1939)-C(5))-methyltransferase RlmD [Bacilli bacterium]